MLAKLRARFHKLIQPSPKPAAKTSKSQKSANSATTASNSPQLVERIRIPLPTSDESHVAKDDSWTVHSLYPADDIQGPLPTGSARESDIVAPAGTLRSPANDVLPRESSTQSIAGDQIEQWPYRPQAAAEVPKLPNPAPPADEFDSIPVAEYQAAVAKANGSQPLPSFHEQPSANGMPETAGPSTGKATVTASPDGVPQPFPAVGTGQSASRPALIKIEQTDPPLPGATQSSPVLRPPQQPSEPEQPVGGPVPAPPAESLPASASSVPSTGTTDSGATTVPPAAPATAVQMSATVPAAAAIAPAPPLRSPQWVGGRYGQPAWMFPYASPAGRGGN